jgi:hypothetical protein
MVIDGGGLSYERLRIRKRILEEDRTASRFMYLRFVEGLWRKHTKLPAIRFL